MMRGRSLFLVLAYSCVACSEASPSPRVPAAAPAGANTPATVSVVPVTNAALDLKVSTRWLAAPVSNPVFEDEAQKVRAATCEDFAKLSYQPRGMLDAVPYMYSKTTCEAWTILAKASASKTSFVRGLETNPSPLDTLPSELSKALGPANAPPLSPGKTWKELRPTAKSSWSNGELHVEDTLVSWSIEQLGTGDVDKDGFEDLIVRVLSSPKGGSAWIMTVYVVSRDKPSGPMRIVSVP